MGKHEHEKLTQRRIAAETLKFESNFKDVEIFLLFSKFQCLFQKRKCIVLFSGTFPNVAEGIH